MAVDPAKLLEMIRSDAGPLMDVSRHYKPLPDLTGDPNVLDIDNCAECPCARFEMRAPPGATDHCGLQEMLDQRDIKTGARIPKRRLVLTRRQVDGREPPPRGCPLNRHASIRLRQRPARPDFVNAPPEPPPQTPDDILADRMRRRRNK